MLCEEAKPPKGEDAICWMLVTTLPVDTNEHVNQVIKYYCQRWSIEVYFRTLKSGCRVEKRRFETLKRMVNCLSVMSVVAWRVMYLCHLGRELPDLPCEALFEEAEWKSVYSVVGKPFPKKGCPKLAEMVRALAQLGGFIDRSKMSRALNLYGWACSVALICPSHEDVRTRF